MKKMLNPRRITKKNKKVRIKVRPKTASYIRKKKVHFRPLNINRRSSPFKSVGGTSKSSFNNKYSLSILKKSKTKSRRRHGRKSLF